MTESPRHQNCVKKLKVLSRALYGQACILENCDERGIGGYRFEPIPTPEGEKQFIADACLKLPTGQLVDFEVDFKKKSSKRAKVKMDQRDAALEKELDVTTIRFTPSAVDLLDKELLAKEIAYWVKVPATL